MRLKILKRIVSVLCVATMTTACIAPSVGAFKAPMNAQVDVVNSVNELNGRLDVLDVTIDQILGATQTEIQTCDANNENLQIKLVTLLSNLEISKQYVKELKDVVVNDSEFAKILKDKVDEANNRVRVLVGEAIDENNPDEEEIWFNYTYFDFANIIREKLEDIKKMIKENADDLNKLKSEFYSKRKEFYVRWDKHVEYRKSVNKDKEPDSTYGARHAAENFSNSISHNLNAQNMKQAIKYFDEAINSMDKFQNDNVNNNNQHDEALKQRIEQTLNEGKMFDENYEDDLTKIQTMKKIQDILLKDKFNDGKQGAEYILGFINRAHMRYKDIARELKRDYVFCIVRDEVNKIYDNCCNNYCNNGGELIAAELGKATYRSDMIDTAIDYGDRESDDNSTFDEFVERACGFVKKVFGYHMDYSVDVGYNKDNIEAFRENINLTKQQCYLKFRKTGDVRWNPLKVELARLDRKISEMESDETLHRLEEFINGPDYSKNCGELVDLFSYHLYPDGIYPMLTGHAYFNDIMTEDQTTYYIGPYPVLHKLYRKIIDFKESFVSGVNQQTLGQRKQIIRQKAEELRRASRQVLEFFNNNH